MRMTPSFLAGLEKRGVSGYTTAQQALTLGHWMCNELRRGRSADGIYSDLMDYTYYEQPIFPAKSGALGQLMGAAWNNLCPDQSGKFIDHDINYHPRGQR
jgi:hypothetical protein